MKKVSTPVASVKESALEIDVRGSLIQALIPLGLAAVEDLLQQEVTQLGISLVPVRQAPPCTQIIKGNGSMASGYQDKSNLS